MQFIIYAYDATDDKAFDGHMKSRRDFILM